VIRPAGDDAARATGRMLPLGSGQPLVLLIEDDLAVADMYALKLRMSGYLVVIAPDAIVAEPLLRRRRPAIVFLDLRLPRKDGLELLAELSESGFTARVPVLVLSNWLAEELAQRVLELGAKRFLVKSDTTPAMLVAEVERWVSRPAQR
jgi:DNA-binding response OmpR family regulator